MSASGIFRILRTVLSSRAAFGAVALLPVLITTATWASEFDPTRFELEGTTNKGKPCGGALEIGASSYDFSMHSEGVPSEAAIGGDLGALRVRLGRDRVTRQPAVFYTVETSHPEELNVRGRVTFVVTRYLHEVLEIRYRRGWGWLSQFSLRCRRDWE
ncbi:MAG: hypothetical protein IT285_11140 [Bdellovibrionales bacterium]|nr:hypothetical protein [Bdellovibrionales bacterium]